jgi:hypothetical protein
MTAKRKISQRELWLVSLLPAGLVLILSQALPDASEEIAAAENRLEQLGSTDARMRQSTRLSELKARLEQSQQDLEALAGQKAELQARVDALQAPVAGRAQSMAQALDTLGQRLAAHKVQVLEAGSAVGDSAASRREPGFFARFEAGSRSGVATPRDWQIGVAATWPAMLAALEDPETSVPGLALSALAMAPARPSLPLRRWVLIVNDLGAEP